jgi:hypothetical protein
MKVKLICPDCGSFEVKKIAYGFPDFDNFVIRERYDMTILVIYNYFADSSSMSIETSCWLREHVRVP